MAGPHGRGAGSFAQLLRERAARSPDALAYRFVADDESAVQITYGELDARARAVAAGLSAATDGRPDPALLLFAPGLDYLAGLFGCFYAGVPAVPAFPPDPARLARTMPRLAAIIEDTGSDTVLTTSDLAPLLAGWLATALAGRAPRLIATDLADPADEGASPQIRPDGLALLQYTSGSTSLPRGVMLSHAQLLDNSAKIARGFGLHQDSSGGVWLPPYHDMGLIGGILTPLSSGIPVTLMSPVTFLRRPLSWLRMVSRYGVTVTGGPNFAYDLCVRRAKDADLEELDLSGVELVFTGAEPVRADTMARFVTRFAPCGFRAESFYPCYGLAEATLFVTGGKPLGGWRSVSVARDALEAHGTARPAGPQERSRSLVSCGSPGPETRLLIADPATGEPLGEGALGEIWIDSPSVADGYWRRPKDTDATFGATTTTGDGPYLRTGDLGFVLDGELFPAGRLKDLIVVNGRNYHPVDIERVCEAEVATIRRNCGAAFAVEDDEGAAERLVLVYEADPAENGQEDEQYAAAVEGLRRAVSMELSVPPYTVVLVRPRTIPKTSSGKVQRWLARRQFLAGELDELARWQAPARPARDMTTPTRGN
ncbi:fatty acyl-AMP ligase [Streptomyces sp. ME19-01-6]|uniref:fatty acyl-AMP ligase n=1 Tax=Streptomyces sp. ME19-01-6 TaxID=3028686 RepID=UPI0029A2E88B|nr:fatty acyl-AMP ligase [Streptomyces sp. ME19-01-6]MDX3224311.1 fatty acyl-AMP ligase [Streptomyces sp. ME19-01-6]